jgi:hypothetical protein
MTRPASAIKSKHKSNFTREDVSYANFAQKRLAEIGHLLMIRTEIAKFECPWKKGNCKLVVTRGRLYQRLSSSSSPFFFIFSTRRGRRRRRRRRPRARALFFRSCPICPVSTLFFPFPARFFLVFLFFCLPVVLFVFFFCFFLFS